MAAHPPRTSTDSTTSGTKLLIALQWALAAIGIFGLTGAAALLMASTPSAWPL
ncbi:MAG: hypothetical protein RR818_02455 [Citrobacter sp.]|uniref:hypothetical protein n=1 Tax=Comamonas TaxID=283 RepID=UPI000C52908A|nr:MULTISPECIES: hypothetical protein [Comamonas]MBI1625207.1 hypothetical protein [Comamonas suwonensis]PIG07831.1 hypothetical protein CLU84_0658 [Comamonas sp. 26]